MLGNMLTPTRYTEFPALIARTRLAACVGAAVTEIASLRAALDGPLEG